MSCLLDSVGGGALVVIERPLKGVWRFVHRLRRARVERGSRGEAICRVPLVGFPVLLRPEASDCCLSPPSHTRHDAALAEHVGLELLNDPHAIVATTSA